MVYKRILQEDLYKMSLDNGISPNFTFEAFDPETNEYINLVIIKTAEEVYQEWLVNKDKPQEPDKMEVLEKQLMQQEEAIGLIATHVAKNTLLNGGMSV